MKKIVLTSSKFSDFTKDNFKFKSVQCCFYFKTCLYSLNIILCTMVIPKLDWSFQCLQFKSIDTPDIQETKNERNRLLAKKGFGLHHNGVKVIKEHYLYNAVCFFKFLLARSLSIYFFSSPLKKFLSHCGFFYLRIGLLKKMLDWPYRLDVVC